MPRTTATVRGDTRTIAYEGVLVSEILSRAGVATGGQMQSPALTMYVVATAKDGFQVVLSLGELDNPLSGANIIVADLMDGQPLPANVGPLRLILPKDARSVRSVRQLERFQVVQIKKQ
jgi:DMSO/TMAO reductase YedYZ molybdopterin-dependent catalytic subunit